MNKHIFVCMSILLSMAITHNSYAYINNNAGVVSYVHDPLPGVRSGAAGAQVGMQDSSFISNSFSSYNPNEWSFNNYIKNKEFVFFVGHGNADVIGGNTPNGFSNQVMHKDEIASNLQSKVVTLMSCNSLQNFGQKLVDNGVSCVVGWEGTIPNDGPKLSTWAEKFYTCADWHDPDYCEDYASLMSNLWGGSTKGDCNSFSMSSRTAPGAFQQNTSPIQGTFLTENGYVSINPQQNLSVKNNESISKTKDEFIRIAQDFLQPKKDFILKSIEDETNTIVVRYSRYIDDIRVDMDENIAVIDKKSGEVYMHKKTFTEDLEDRYIFKYTKDDIISIHPDIKELNNVEKILMRLDGKVIMAWKIDYIDNYNLVQSRIISDETKSHIEYAK